MNEEARVERQSYRDVAAARYVHEMSYLRHRTGASEAEIRRVMAKVGSDRTRIERELAKSQGFGH